MRTFHWVSGELTEVQRFINVPMRWCEQYPPRERRELWIKAIDGPDVKFVVHTRFLPARRGHDLDALLFGDLPVGLFNHSTIAPETGSTSSGRTRRCCGGDVMLRGSLV